jgi:DNA-nicking Smr family endonuclease
MTQNQNDVIHIPIDGVLDLHTFNPRDVSDLLNEYIHICMKAGIFELRIIHGKGKGILRDRVHSILKKNPFVMDFKLDPEGSGWGATIVQLKNNSSLS